MTIVTIHARSRRSPQYDLRPSLAPQKPAGTMPFALREQQLSRTDGNDPPPSTPAMVLSAVDGMDGDANHQGEVAPGLRSSRLDGWMTGFATVASLLFLTWVIAARRGLLPGEAQGAVFTHSLLVALYAITIRLAWVGSKGLRQVSPAAARAWLILGAAQFPAAFISASWVYRLTSGVTAAGGVLPQAAAAAYYLCTFVALLSYPTLRGRTAAHRRASWLDAATVALAGCVLSWHLLFRALLVQHEAGMATTLYTLVYPTADVVLLFAVAALLLRRPAAGSLPAIRLIAAGIAINAVANLAYMWAYVSQNPRGSEWYDAGYVVVAWLILLAGWRQLRDQPGQRSHQTPVVTASHNPSLLPYAMIAAVQVVALAQAFLLESALDRQTVDSRYSLPGGTTWALTILVLGVGGVTALVVIRQITVQRLNSRLLAEKGARDARYRALVQHGSDILLVLDSQGSIQEVSESMARVLGLDADSLRGLHVADLATEDGADVVRADLSEIVAHGHAGVTAAPTVCEWQVTDSTGRRRWLEVVLSNMRGVPEVDALVVNARDVTERKALEQALAHRAQHDWLTGLANRMHFRERVCEQLERALNADGTAEERTTIAVLYLDLDEFKPVNDCHGHAAGDEVLMAVADRLRSATRGSDLVARLGGDEFGMILAPLRHVGEAEVVAERVIRAVRRPIVLSTGVISVGASVGIAYTTLPRGLNGRERGSAAEWMEWLLRDADAAMYDAKARGRARGSIGTGDGGHFELRLTEGA